jgi:hypothetical protein
MWLLKILGTVTAEAAAHAMVGTANNINTPALSRMNHSLKSLLNAELEVESRHKSPRRRVSGDSASAARMLPVP